MVFPRIPLLLLVALSACEQAPGIESEGGKVVSCALSGATDFSSECRLVEKGEGRTAYFVMRHTDGGFRKLALAETPAGFVEFDGSQPAESWREGEMVVLQIGADRYRWKDTGRE